MKKLSAARVPTSEQCFGNKVKSKYETIASITNTFSSLNQIIEYLLLSPWGLDFLLIIEDIAKNDKNFSQMHK